MNTMLVWILMIAPYDGRSIHVFSPPVVTLQDCQRMQAFVKESSGRASQCVQVKVPNNWRYQEELR
jgi:hypothetical protein